MKPWWAPVLYVTMDIAQSWSYQMWLYFSGANSQKPHETAEFWRTVYRQITEAVNKVLS